MRHWVHLAARLYPRAWRIRYGAEFDALLEETEQGWPQLFDVIGGALKMQLNDGGIYWKLGGGLALAGALVALCVVSLQSPRYESRAVLQITAADAAPGSTTPDKVAEQTASWIQDVLAQKYLEAIIRNPAFNLYKKTRDTTPMEDVVEQMRRDIRVSYSPTLGPQGGRARGGIVVGFVYQDPKVAHNVVSELASRFVAASKADSPAEIAVSYPRDTLEVVQPATLPTEPADQKRSRIIGLGLGLGLASGLTVSLLMRRRRWTLGMLAFAATGFVAGGVTSLVIPRAYRSMAVLALQSPSQPAQAPTNDTFAWLTDAMPQILNRDNVTRIILDPHRDLYRKQRATTPIDQVADAMLKDIKIAVMDKPGGPHAFSISFTYYDPYRAQAVVAELITQFTAVQQTTPQRLVILDKASLASNPMNGNPLALAYCGLLLGVILGGVILYLRRSRGQTLIPA